MKQMAFVSIIGGILLSSISFGYSGGDGSEEKPYGIASKIDLLTLAASTRDYSKCFILKEDIDLTGEYFTAAVIAPDTDNTTGGFQGMAFTGVFDGNGYKIRNLIIAGCGNDYVGLFGCIDTTRGTIKNLGLMDAEIVGRDSVGVLAGQTSGIITACYATGTADGSIYVGGLVGGTGGTITACFALGAVNGSDYYAGGLAGGNVGTINACYATGAVNGGSEIGGLVGVNEEGKVIQCYSAGRLTGAMNVGGLCGFAYVGREYEDTGNFWDMETSGTSVSMMGIGKPTAQMKMLETFTGQGWDFNSTWAILEYQTYPYLQTYLTADLNMDGQIDLLDIFIFASQWLDK